MLSSNPSGVKARRVDAKARLAPFLTVIPTSLVLLTLGLQLAAPSVTEAYALYPLLLGIILLGLPHGALDHLVPARLGLTWGRKPLGVALYLLAYVAVAALYLALWLWQPAAAFIGFLAATVWHWGQGDQRFLEIFLGRRRPTRWGAWVTLLVRGSLPIVLPVLAFPETAESLYRHAATGLGLPDTTLTLTSPWLVVPLVLLFAASLLAYALNAVRAAPDATVLAIDGAEVLLLILLFTLVPAYMSVGVYFLFWHSLRHLGRLLILRPQDAASVAQGDWQAPVKRLTLDLLPVTSAALCLLGGFYLFNAARITSLEGFVALYLILISALTKPHLVVVAMMDLAPDDAPKGAPTDLSPGAH